MFHPLYFPSEWIHMYTFEWNKNSIRTTATTENIGVIQTCMMMMMMMLSSMTTSALVHSTALHCCHRHEKALSRENLSILLSFVSLFEWRCCRNWIANTRRTNRHEKEHSFLPLSRCSLSRRRIAGGHKTPRSRFIQTISNDNRLRGIPPSPSVEREVAFFSA